MSPPEQQPNEAQDVPEIHLDGVKVELAHHTDQLNRLWDVNTEQTKQLAKLEEVPAKLDQLLSMNVALATLQQQQATQSGLLKQLWDKYDGHENRLHSVDKKFSYYAGALAVAGLLFGAVVWMGQQAVTGAWAELTTIHTTIQDLQTQVKLMQLATKQQH